MFKQLFLSLSLIGGGALGVWAMPAGAVSLPVASNSAVQGNHNAGNLIEVRHRSDHHQAGRYWDRQRHGNRCRTRYGNCRHYHQGYYYATPWWTLPLIGGAYALGAQGRDYNRYGNDHVQWCLDRYRSYNVRTNTWVSYSGDVRRCRSPYM
jgi:BA14K-like protein